ncbi:hypothetical protein HYQ45_007727 [Verticillium longisporum]|uniref:Uncharacterized protein n=1 Tax=Verticillium longisporum TaxID=100787 RepID=A0A8I2ZNM2_VERLO|nr:hypothetical protein HYQ44_006843 [Verticillium longisporum]KAG7134222.1 hypothetical protein HYQ45_007727 [Verticillium longisporum]
MFACACQLNEIKDWRDIGRFQLRGPQHVDNNIALAHQYFRKKKQANRKFGACDENPGDVIPINAGDAVSGNISRIESDRLDLVLRVQFWRTRHRFVAIATRNMISAQPW